MSNKVYGPIVEVVCVKQGLSSDCGGCVCQTTSMVRLWRLCVSNEVYGPIVEVVCVKQRLWSDCGGCVCQTTSMVRL